RDGEVLSDLLERVLAAVREAEAQPQHLLLARRERVQDLVGLLAQGEADDRLDGRDDLLVLDEIAQMAVFFLADRRLQRDRLLRDFENFAHLVDRHVRLGRGLVRSGLAAELLHELAGGSDELVDGLDHVHGDADGARLVGDRAGDRLADPPGRIRRELVAATVFELVDGLHEADVAFLDEVEELQTAVRVLLRDRDHEPEVRLDHLFLRAPRLRLAQRALAIDLLDVAGRERSRLLDLLQPLLGALDFFLELVERRRVLALRADVLVDPVQIRLVLREARDEVLARHARVADAERHDLALESADL